MLCVKHGSETSAKRKKNLLMYWKQPLLIVPILLPGFQSIHESLELLRQIQNTRLKLEKKKIQKDMKKMQWKWPPRRLNTKSKPCPVSQVLLCSEKQHWVKPSSLQTPDLVFPSPCRMLLLVMILCRHKNNNSVTPTALFTPILHQNTSP